MESVTAGINAAPTEKLLGESPDSVKKCIKDGEKSSDPAAILNFQLQASNAEAFKKNIRWKPSLKNLKRAAPSDPF